MVQTRPLVGGIVPAREEPEWRCIGSERFIVHGFARPSTMNLQAWGFDQKQFDDLRAWFEIESRANEGATCRDVAARALDRLTVALFLK